MNLYAYTLEGLCYLIVAQTTYQVVERMEKIYSKESLKRCRFNHDSVKLISCDINNEILVVHGSCTLRSDKEEQRIIG